MDDKIPVIISIARPTIKSHRKHGQPAFKLLQADGQYATLLKCGCVNNEVGGIDGCTFSHAVVLHESGKILETLNLEEFLDRGVKIDYCWPSGEERVFVYLHTGVRYVKLRPRILVGVAV